MDIYHFIGQEELKKYAQEQERRRSIEKDRQKSQAEYLNQQMAEKKRRAKLDYDLSIKYDNLMVHHDKLRVEKDALKIVENR